MNSEMAHCYHRRIRLGSARYVSSETVVIFASNNASINVKPKREGERTPGIYGAFDFYCLPHPREFDYESASQGGTFAFFARRNGTKPHRLMCSSVRFWIS